VAEPEPTPTAVDLRELSDQFFTELAGPLEEALGSKKDAGKVEKIVKEALFITIRRMSRARRLEKEKGGRAARSRKFRKAKISLPLPVEDLKPDEVIERGLVEMSVANLYRATQDGRFYCATPRGKRIGRVYPAWQFEEPVVGMLPQVLSVLKEQGEAYIHARMVSEDDDLMELAPAEVLAGRLFNPNQELDPEQAALLQLPAPERLALVKEVFGKPSRQNAIG
jgi:hypothetical protein